MTLQAVGATPKAHDPPNEFKQAMLGVVFATNGRTARNPRLMKLENEFFILFLTASPDKIFSKLGLWSRGDD